jgi:bisphosphoglycerate-dependent phosphoglycerate mutase
MRHGTLAGYNKHRCRCEFCRNAWNTYQRSYQNATPTVDRALMSDLLHELFPNGMTSDAPLARAHREAA